MAYPYQKKKGGPWYIGYVDEHGRARRKKSSARTKTEAQRLANEAEIKSERVRLGLEQGVSERRTFGSVAKLYLETNANVASFDSMEGRFRRHLIPVFGEKYLDEILPGDIERFLVKKAGEARCRWSKKEGCNYIGKLKDVKKPCPECGGRLSPAGPQTREHLRVHMQALYTFAIKKERCFRGENPASVVPKVQLPLTTPKHLEVEWITQVIAEVNARQRNLFACAVYTGLRKGELLGLYRAQVDLERRIIEVIRSHGSETTKGKKARIVPIPEELLPYLRAQLNVSQASDYLFPNPAGERQSESIDFPDMLRRALRRLGIVRGYNHVCRRKGCGFKEQRADNAVKPCPKCAFQLMPVGIYADFSFKDLRSTFGTFATEMTGDIRFTQQGLGHGDVKITEKHYARYRPERLLAQADQIRFQKPALASVTHPALTGPQNDEGPRSPEGLQVAAVAGESAARDTGFEPVAFGSGGLLQWDVKQNQQGSSGVIAGTSAVASVARSAHKRQQGPTATHPALTAIHGEGLLLPDEVAARLRLPRSSIYRLVKLGRLPAVRIEHQLRFRPADVEAYLAGGGR